MGVEDRRDCRFRWDLLASLLPADSVGAEVGVLKGRNATSLLELRADLFLYLIDPFNIPHGRHTVRDVSQAEDVARFKLHPFSDQVQFIKRSSLGAAPTFSDSSLDWVFIDADHHYSSVKADIWAWIPKVRPGGALLGHDYRSPRWPGVKQAVDEVLGDQATLYRTQEDCYCWGFWK